MSTITGSVYDVETWFNPNGLIAGVKKNFAPREGQEELAQMIVDANTEGKIVIAECPTGFGKSFTVLVPAIIEAMKNNQRIVISTETLTLQDQYINKDLALLFKALGDRGVKFSYAVAKGRNNYVCRRKLPETTFGHLSPLEMWADKITLENSNGCLSSIPESVDYTAMEWLGIAADDDCEAKACSYYGGGMKANATTDCFVYQSKKEFKAANIVVANHTLTLLDAMTGVGSILGEYDMLIVDEAHSLPEKAVDVWGQTFKKNTITKTLNWIDKRLEACGIRYFERGYAREWYDLEAAMFEPFTGVRTQSVALRDIQPYKLVEESQIAADALINKLIKVRRGIGDARQETEAAADMVGVCKEKLTKLIGGLQNIYGENMDEEHKDNWLAFLETRAGRPGDKSLILNLKPIEVAPLMHGLLWNQVNSAVLVSATMKVNNSFAYMKRTMGLSSDRLVEFTGKAPFDFSANVKGYFPKHLSHPPEYKDKNKDEQTERYLMDLEDEIVKVIEMMGGRTLILFTNMSHMNTIHERIICGGRVPYDCYLQGDKSKSVLIDMFQRNVSSCLFATRSFYTGVDIPGEALSCVVLTKCPFPVPSDPLFAARSQKIEDRGQKAFDQLSIPMMMFDVKQAFGRLIRTHTDEGVFVLLDSKAMSKGYFAKIKAGLPEFPIYEKI